MENISAFLLNHLKDIGDKRSDTVSFTVSNKGMIDKHMKYLKDNGYNVDYIDMRYYEIPVCNYNKEFKIKVVIRGLQKLPRCKSHGEMVIRVIKESLDNGDCGTSTNFNVSATSLEECNKTLDYIIDKGYTIISCNITKVSSNRWAFDIKGVIKKGKHYGI